MPVNITLFAQAINFFIAWLLLHIFYFKPAVQVLDDQQHEQDQLEVEKAALQLSVEHKQHDLETGWRKLKQFVRQSGEHAYTHTEIPKFVFKLEEHPENPIDGAEHERLVQELTDKIISQVPHVEL